ncbi:MAG: Gamma-glutamyl phosphate reductase [Alphaproteobacteria bacterium MarineAlpha2_Bin1]|nr:MAG: Gamma-glutamyl phosphate reductase [Alphaproteobacteria bacterium MarineAlpha2_Bin1]
MQVKEIINNIAKDAKSSLQSLRKVSLDQKNDALNFSAESIINNIDRIIYANKEDIEFAYKKGIKESLIQRLKLDEGKIRNISKSLNDVANLPNPLGKITESRERPNGLTVKKISVPIGVIGIIYESRPNVTSDAASLCLKSGNACILKCGSESFNSSKVIMENLHFGLNKAKITLESIQMIPTRSREAVSELLKLKSTIDIIIPRGGKSLIEKINNETKIPVISHLDGNCHTYIHKDADIEKSLELVINAKFRNISICGATESLLIDRSILSSHLPKIIESLVTRGCKIYGDNNCISVDKRILNATEDDWYAEYLDSKISVKSVTDINQAITHIQKYGSGHTDCIITENKRAASKFFNEIDSAIVMHNTSTQFADGGEFGLGSEIGISTNRLHARGPVGLEELTTYKWLVESSGQVRV